METSSFQRLTTSGVVGTSGKAIDVVGYAVEGVTGAANPAFRNGTAVGSPHAFFAKTVGTGLNDIVPFCLPVRLGSGCFVSLDTNTVSVTVFFVQTLSS